MHHRKLLWQANDFPNISKKINLMYLSLFSKCPMSDIRLRNSCLGSASVNLFI
jgi:hypothetical protein